MKEGILMGKYVVIGLVVLMALFGVGNYNSIQEAAINIDAKYGQVENQMQRRADLIPNLVATVKGYAAHEEKIMTEVAEARAKLGSAATPLEKDAANTELTSALGRLLMVAENYPDLKANTQYTELMRELSGTENRIAVARKDYNEAVQSYNVKIQTFPGVVFAGMMGAAPREQFKADESAKEVPKVNF